MAVATDVWRAAIDEPDPGMPEVLPRFHFTRGGSFLLDQPDRIPAIWGTGDAVLWAEGESVMLAGPQGIYKSTLAQNLALGRIGLPEFAEVLGHPVRADEGRVLYLAMDRPRQIARSMARMIGAAHRAELDDRLVVWQGPPPGDLAMNDHLLVDMALEAGASTVIVDSLKDAVRTLNDDELASGYNRARGRALREGVQVLDVHHTRKRSQSASRTTSAVDEVYGSTWLTAGIGSLLTLSGESGDPLVKITHAKTPLSEVGPLTMTADEKSGLVSIWESVDLVTIAKRDAGVTARQAAELLFDVEKPTAGQVEKARRKLDALTREGALEVASEGSRETSTSTIWRAL